MSGHSSGTDPRGDSRESKTSKGEALPTNGAMGGIGLEGKPRRLRKLGVGNLRAPQGIPITFPLIHLLTGFLVMPSSRSSSSSSSFDASSSQILESNPLPRIRIWQQVAISRSVSRFDSYLIPLPILRGIPIDRFRSNGPSFDPIDGDFARFLVISWFCDSL
uniref:Uncharacterized protein n=1 Tax=Musa acuminata TaxID=4641 RepID=Q1ENZ6_MUSAC|nr:hypothetical protein MA4_112I10.48 [Musa acuminata]